jgi:hypothetical protein
MKHLASGDLIDPRASSIKALHFKAAEALPSISPYSYDRSFLFTRNNARKLLNRVNVKRREQVNISLQTPQGAFNLSHARILFVHPIRFADKSVYRYEISFQSQRVVRGIPRLKMWPKVEPKICIGG